LIANTYPSASAFPGRFEKNGAIVEIVFIILQNKSILKATAPLEEIL
jgi:hypothetical protein